jgi:predicted transcriptional regulator
MESMPTQQEIAIMVNMSCERVSRVIQILLQKSMVEKDLRRLIARQPEEPSKAVKQFISTSE